MKIYIRVMLYLGSVFVGILLLNGQAPAPGDCPPVGSDPYSVSFVNSALQFIQKGGSSVEGKKYTHLSPSLPQLGDGVSVAVLKIHDRNELIKPENANAYLTAVRLAFSDRNRVSDKSDREPRVTLLVLDYLEEKEVSEPGLEKRIAYMKGCVRDFTCSSTAEGDYFKSRKD
jgi:hypothetical protein